MGGRSGGRILVESLIALGATKSFGVPGESYLAVLDALHDAEGRLDFVTCRHEGGAAFMAAAYGKLTGAPGICFVTRGPGATNAAIGVHTARQDSAPMLLFVGQAATGMLGREAFQEIEYRDMFGGVAKWAAQVDQADRLPETIARAWSVATTGRRGPVVVALPEDVLSEATDAPPLAGPAAFAEPAPSAETAERIRALLAAASRPVVLLGGCDWTQAGRAALQRFAEASDIPAIAAFRYQDRFDNHSPSYCGEAGVGMPAHVRRILSEADAILAVNARFGEMTTDGYRLMTPPAPAATLIHAHAAAEEIGKIYQPALGVQAGPNALAAALAPVSGAWGAWRAQARAEYLESLSAPAQPSPVDMVAVCAWLRETLPEDVIVTNGAGNFTVWPNKFLQYGPSARLLAPQSGAMGYGLPAAIAAKTAHPDRMVLCFAGDGDLQMTLGELGTAMQFGAQPIVLVINNGVYGTIRAHQEREYPDRVSGTDLKNPDFSAIARAYGFHAERVARTEEFPDAFARARAAPGGAVLDLDVAAEAITPRQTLSAIRAAARARAAGPR